MDLEKKAQKLEQDIQDLKKFMDENKDLDLKGFGDKIKNLEEKINAIPEQVELKDAEEIKSLNDALNKLNKELKDSKETKLEVKTLGDSLVEVKGSPELKGLADKIAKNKGSIKGLSGVFEIKADVLTTSLTGDRQRSLIESGVDKPLYRMPFMRELVVNVPTTVPVIKWTERTARTDGSGGVAEGAAAGQSDSTWEEKERKVVKRGVHFKYSAEMFEDLPQLVEDLRADTMTEMNLDIDNQMFKGDGTGTNFYGLITDATAFNATTAGLNLKVVKPNFADVLKAAALQARLKHFNPDVAIVHPSDFALLELEKDTDGNYVLPPFKTADGTLVAGMRIVQNTNVDVNSALVFDSMLPRFYVSREMQMQVWDQNEDDALKDLKTVTLWFRGQMRVRENEKLGIISIPDIAAAITALTKP